MLLEPQVAKMGLLRQLKLHRFSAGKLEIRESMSITSRYNT